MDESKTVTNDELMHYGVPGMRWGIKRASKRLANATTREARDKAIAKLNKHKEKASKKISKLDKKRPRLEKKVEKALVKHDVKVAKLRRKALKLQRKAGGFFVSENRAQKLMTKGLAKQAKSDMLRSKSDLSKAKLAKNNYLTNEYKKGITNIDEALKKKNRKR